MAPNYGAAEYLLSMTPGFLSRLARLGMLVAGASSGLSHVVVSAQPAPGLAPPPSERIVILTFANSSGEPEHEWIGTGLAETIVTDLESLGTLQVVAQETCLLYTSPSPRD